MSNYTPREHDMLAMKHLISRPHAGLFEDMGLGKTGQVLATLETLLEKEGKLRVLLIAPIRTLYTTWPDEIEKWGFQLSYLNHHVEADGRECLFTHEANIHGINPEGTLPLLQDPRFAREQWDVLVIDESSMYKAHDSRRFKLLRPHLHRFGRRWILTGTPAPNGLIDIWSQIFLVDRGQALGEYITRFRNAFCVPDWNGYDYSLQPGAAEEIYRRIAPYILRMEAKDYIDMPELIYNSVPVKLDAKTMRMYRDMEDTFLLQVGDDMVMSPNSAVAGQRCRQIANGGIYVNPLGQPQEAVHIHNLKTDALKELVESLQGKPAIVFYEFQHDQSRIRAALGKLAYDPTPDNLRLFNEGKIPVLLGHPSSMGYGLNLQTHCNTIIWYGIPWDLAAYDQAIARVWRSGQTADHVIVHHIVASKTLDETVLQVLGEKAKDQKTLLDAMKARKT